jgi:hypothetical protein
MLPATLYVARPVLNAAEILDWFRQQGISPLLTPDDLHVTIAFSRKEVDWEAPGTAPNFVDIQNFDDRSISFLGPKDALVMKFQSGELTTRWEQFRLCGASWDYPSYQPHMTLSYEQDRGREPGTYLPFPGVIHLGPETFKPLDTDWVAVEKSRDVDEALVFALPVIVKARMNGVRRIIEVEASNESVDYDGDVILQKALLDSASTFLARGHLDLDHISEFGQRLGIADPASYIIGRPLEVKDVGEGRTSVVGEIRRSLDGVLNTAKNRYDDFWASMQSNPPVNWQASVYGFPKPGMIRDCQKEVCASGATRFLVEGFDWCSLALTRTPKNLGLKGSARIVTAKSFMAEMAKSMGHPAPVSPPRSVSELWNARVCPLCGAHESPTTVGYREHYRSCMGVSDDVSDLYAHAIMHRYAKSRF